MSKRTYFDNKRGYLAIEEFLKLLKDGSIEQYTKDFSPIRHKCPPVNLISKKSVPCFYCTQCHQESANHIKEYKKYYKIGRKKYPKEDLDNMEEVNIDGDM